MTVAYAQTHGGNRTQFEPEVINRDFMTATQHTQQELGGILSKSVIEDARKFLVAKRSYYQDWKPNQESVDSTDNEIILTEGVS